MAKAHSATTDVTVRNPRTGQFVTVRGVGALKGHLTLDETVDLTKPIAAQAMRGKPRKMAAAKH